VGVITSVRQPPEAARKGVPGHLDGSRREPLSAT
jgi:hypothetical protein